MVSIRPDADVAVGAWATAPLFSKLNDQNSATFISATAVVTGGSVSLANLGLDPATQRVVRFRLKALVATSGGAICTINPTPGSLGGGLWPNTAVITVPGSPPDPGLTEWYTSPWQYKNENNDEITTAQIDSLGISFGSAVASGYIALKELIANVDYRNKATASLVNPDEDSSGFGTATIIPLIEHRLTWIFSATNSNGASLPQKKYRLKIFTDAVVSGGGFDPDTSPTVYDSGEQKSSSTFAYYDGYVGGEPVSQLEPGTNYWAYLQVAQDFYGSDWWSDWISARMVTISRPTTSGMLLDATRSNFGLQWVYAQADGFDQGGAEVRYYLDDGTIAAADPDGDNPDALNQDLLVWEGSHELANQELNMEATDGQANGDYRLYLRVKDAEHGVWSIWYHNDFTFTEDDPPTPTLSLVDDPDAARIIASVAFADIDASGTVIADALKLEHKVDGSWEEVHHYEWNEEVPATYLDFDGTVSEGLTTPGAAYALVTHDRDQEWEFVAAPADWTPASEQILMSAWDSVAGQRTFKMGITSAGELIAYWSPDGTVVKSATSTANLAGLADGEARELKYVLDVSASEITFYHRAVGASTWTQLGTPVVHVGDWGFFHNGGEDVALGSTDGLTAGQFTGRIYSATWRSVVVSTMIDVWRWDSTEHLVGERFDGLVEPVEEIAITITDGVPIVYEIDISDYTVPFNVATDYRARTRGLFTDGQRRLSPWSTTATDTLAILNKVWLKAVHDPTLNGTWPVQNSWVVFTHAKSRAVQRPISRRLAVVSKGLWGGRSFTLTFTVLEADNIQALVDLLESNETLLVQFPEEQIYCEVSGDFALRDHLWDLLHGQVDVAQLNVPFEEVTRP